MGGMFVYLPTFVMKVDTSVNYHLDYQPMGRSLALLDLDYVQPRCVLSTKTCRQRIYVCTKVDVVVSIKRNYEFLLLVK